MQIVFHKGACQKVLSAVAAFTELPGNDTWVIFYCHYLLVVEKVVVVILGMGKQLRHQPVGYEFYTELRINVLANISDNSNAK